MIHQRNRDFIIIFKDEKVATENFQINRKRNFAKPTASKIQTTKKYHKYYRQNKNKIKHSNFSVNINIY